MISAVLDNRRFRSWGGQILLLGGFAALLLWLVNNTVTNLDARGIKVGFDFLWRRANFPISESVLPYDPSDTFLTRFQDTVKKKSRRLMVTRRGEVGMAPCRTRVGDAVVVLFGCSIPLVLRRVGAMEAWQVVGEAYVHGLMNGEVEDLVMSGERSVRRIRLV